MKLKDGVIEEYKYDSEVLKYKKKNELFLNRFSTILLVQSRLLPPSVLGIKDPKDKL